MAFMPDSSGKLLDQLAVEPNSRDFAAFTRDHAMVPGTPLPAPTGIFPRFVETEEGAA